MFEDFKTIVGDISKRRKDAEKQIEHLPYDVTLFSAESLNRMLQINSDLRRMVTGLDTKTAVSVVQAYLNSLPWKAKFRTGEIGKEKDDSDSIYFITPDNISLRLKLSNVSSGDITKVIQPFFEKVVFEDDQNDISLNPEIGLIPQEYCSPEFIELQKAQNVSHDFQSQIRMYHDSTGKIVFVKDVLGGYKPHTGSKINRLL